MIWNRVIYTTHPPHNTRIQISLILCLRWKATGSHGQRNASKALSLLKIRLKPNPVSFVNYNIADFNDRLSWHLTTCSRLEAFTRTRITLALRDFCEEKYRDTPNQKRKCTQLQQHTCVAFKTKLKLHHAQLSSAPNFWKPHSCAVAKIE